MENERTFDTSILTSFSEILSRNGMEVIEKMDFHTN